MVLRSMFYCDESCSFALNIFCKSKMIEIKQAKPNLVHYFLSVVHSCYYIPTLQPRLSPTTGSAFNQML